MESFQLKKLWYVRTRPGSVLSSHFTSLDCFVATATLSKQKILTRRIPQYYYQPRSSLVLEIKATKVNFSTIVWFKKNGYTFATVFSNKCVTVFLNQTLCIIWCSGISKVIKIAKFKWHDLRMVTRINWKRFGSSNITPYFSVLTKVVIFGLFLNTRLNTVSISVFIF